MSTIKPFISTDVAQPGPTLPTISPDQAGMLESATARGYSAMSELHGRIAQQMASRASSALSMHYEAGAKSKLAQVQFENYVQNPGIVDAIAKGASNETLLVMKQAEAKRLEELPKLEMNFLDTATPKIQEGYLLAKQEALRTAKPDGSDYMEKVNQYFDKATEEWMAQAPSELSAAEMMNRVQDFKLKALTTGLQIEESMRTGHALNQANEAADSLIRQAIANPSEFESYLAQSTDLQQTLREAGFSDTDVNKWVSDQRNKISVAHLEAQAMRDPLAALTELAYSPIIENISPNEIIRLSGRLNDAVTQQYKAEDKAIGLQQAYTRIMSGGPLNKDIPADKEAGNAIYGDLTDTIRNPETGSLDFKNGGSEILFNAIKMTKGFLPDRAKADLTNAVRYGDPDSAVGASLIIKRLSQEPELQHQAAGVDSKDYQIGILVADALAGGESPLNAVQAARKQFLSTPGSLDDMRNKQADIYLNAETVLDDLEGQFSSWIAPVLGVTEFFAGEGYRTQGSKFFNPENAGVAAGEYKRLFRKAYLESGDEKAAKSWALTQLSRTWAASAVNGNSEVMQYAPSVLFGAKESDFNNRFWETKKEVLASIPEAEDLVINSIDMHGVNRAQLNGTYPVYFVDKDGFKRPLLDEVGRQKVYNYTAGLSEEERDAIIEARKKREQIANNQRERRRITDDVVNHLLTSPSVAKMTNEQKVMLKKQLQTISIGK